MLDIALINTTLQSQLDSLSAVYLYGSFANGTATQHSDVDIAILASEPINPLVLFELRYLLEKQLDRTVDLIDLMQANTVLVNQVCTAGERIYSVDSAHADAFEAYQLKEWIWLNAHRQTILKEVSK